MMIFMMSMMMIISIGVKGKCSNERLSISVNLSSELTSTKGTLANNKTDKEELKLRQIDKLLLPGESFLIVSVPADNVASIKGHDNSQAGASSS